MRYANSSTSDGYHGSLLKGFVVTLDYPPNCLDSLGHSNIWQQYEARVWNSLQVDQLPEFLVHRYRVPCSLTLPPPAKPCRQGPGPDSALQQRRVLYCPTTRPTGVRRIGLPRTSRSCH